MLKLDSGNVLLKPSTRRQLTHCLKRVDRLGDRLGDFAMVIALRQTGRCCEMTATVHDAVGDFSCRVRQQDWRHACREITRSLSCRLRDQRNHLLLSPAT